MLEWWIISALDRTLEMTRDSRSQGRSRRRCRDPDEQEAGISIGGGIIASSTRGGGEGNDHMEGEEAFKGDSCVGTATMVLPGSSTALALVHILGAEYVLHSLRT